MISERARQIRPFRSRQHRCLCGKRERIRNDERAIKIRAAAKSPFAGETRVGPPAVLAARSARNRRLSAPNPFSKREELLIVGHQSRKREPKAVWITARVRWLDSTAEPVFVRHAVVDAHVLNSLRKAIAYFSYLSLLARGDSREAIGRKQADRRRPRNGATEVHPPENQDHRYTRTSRRTTAQLGDAPGFPPQMIFGPRRIRKSSRPRSGIPEHESGPELLLATHWMGQ